MADIDEVNPTVSFIVISPDTITPEKTTKKTKVKIPYYTIIKEHSKIYKLPTNLVAATVRVESNFNQYAVSKDNAIGLMQLVPEFGGREGWERVHGYKKTPTSSELYVPSTNIQLGCAYLWCLKNNYFYRIKNSESKLYCVISAYNTGSSNVAKAFVSDFEMELEYENFKNMNRIERETIRMNIAIERINKYTPEQVKQHLLSFLPYRETINYLRNVLLYMEEYENH